MPDENQATVTQVVTVTEMRPAYHVTMDVVVVTDSQEMRLIEKFRQMRRDWLKHKRRMVLMMDLDGAIYVFQGEPCGRIEMTG